MDFGFTLQRGTASQAVKPVPDRQVRMFVSQPGIRTHIHRVNLHQVPWGSEEVVARLADCERSGNPAFSAPDPVTRRLPLAAPLFLVAQHPPHARDSNVSVLSLQPHWWSRLGHRLRFTGPCGLSRRAPLAHSSLFGDSGRHAAQQPGGSPWRCPPCSQRSNAFPRNSCHPQNRGLERFVHIGVALAK